MAYKLTDLQIKAVCTSVIRRQGIFARTARDRPVQLFLIVGEVANRLIENPDQDRDQLRRDVRDHLTGGVLSTVLIGVVTKVLIETIYRWLVEHDFVPAPLEGADGDVR